MDKNYDSKKLEKWQNFWEKNKIYNFDFKSKKKIFSIDVPPPYASAGHLHVGHALHYTQFEIIARYKRMRDYNVYFAPCFDNNGLPTEKYVEETYNINKATTKKQEFRELCRKASKEVEKEYSNNVFRKLGYSYDWNLLYTTIDKEAQKVAQTSFVDLYEKKLAYRSEEPTLYCVNHQTALAQAEIEDLKRTTVLNYVKFDLDSEQIVIATTRPELLGSCVGIFVNSKDKRYKNLIGKKATVPLFNHKVEIMKDELVDMNFGTGIVMICTFGDSTDILWWKKHKLPLKITVTEDGRLNTRKYKGLMLKEAKEIIIGDLKKENRLVKQENLDQTVGSCWRCHRPIEFLVTKQWFIKTLNFKKELIQQGRKIKWIPEFYKKRYEDWTNNLSWDWCISRQRYYGVPMPVWYCKKCGNIIVADKKDLPVDPEISKPKKKCKCGSNEFIAEKDVFDTWMTSSMTPQIAGRWLGDFKEYKKLYPFSIRPQSHDIIRTWAFYTILKSYLHFKSIPWKEVLIGTFVLDSKGRGMHKSKGDVIWADELLKKYDVDSVRYWVGTANFGEDLMFKEEEIIAGRRFLTKLWNSARFCLMHLKKYKNKKVKLETFDRWLLVRLNNLIKEVTHDFDSYKIADGKKKIEKFFWHDFCDNYLEIIKDRLYNKKRKGKESAQYVMYNVLLNLLKLIAPIMPFITEEIYQNYFIKFEKSKSIHISKWPSYDSKLIDKNLEKLGNEAVELIEKVRQFKANNKKSLKEEVVLTMPIERFKLFVDDIKAVTNAKEILDGNFKVEL